MTLKIKIHVIPLVFTPYTRSLKNKQNHSLTTNLVQKATIYVHKLNFKVYPKCWKYSTLLNTDSSEVLYQSSIPELEY